MSPTPIPPSTVQVALQYIAPPSQLDQPLPPFLVSKSLLQRHLFLNISPDEPHEYLCWPSSSSGTSLKAIDLLESLPRPLDDDAPVRYPIHYTADDEHTYAHVHLISTGEQGVRLVFQWDELDGWKFHDTNLMPFPVRSQSSLRDVLTAARTHADAHAPIKSVDHNPYGFDENDYSDDDDYWNAYGAQDMTGENPEYDRPASVKDLNGGTEDAYWAQYSSVHGTADSTRPSPLPLHRRKPHPFDGLPSDPNSPHPLPVPVRIQHGDSFEEALPIPPSAIPRPNTRLPWDPASPRTLSRLLAAISPRDSRSQTPDPSTDYEADMDYLSPPEVSSGSEESDTPSPPALGLVGDKILVVSQKLVDQSVPASLMHRSTVQANTEGDDDRLTVAVMDEDEYGLRVSLQGLYSLWKTSRGRRALDSGESDKEAFMRIVEEVVG